MQGGDRSVDALTPAWNPGDGILGGTAKGITVRRGKRPGQAKNQRIEVEIRIDGHDGPRCENIGRLLEASK
ncbi:MAG TPA: hypothetical protein VGJ20_33020 [Xanthobacteraceae bacterium]